ncbi:uncharacterized protein si:ch211-156j16.1 [Thalassophryne amazonica]|uniref:uncharacterized protein si:ch211-156j16.1 n=1 Tax=Thalassophryne amazonica TaxID=390379 RepID=UPI00147190E9|nr:uncharacterized protein si:ch211-156j16.1 [Thalassophryne amazonica]
MEVQLLLLLALLGLFSTCTVASPTGIPEDDYVTLKEATSATTEIVVEEVTDVTWSPSTNLVSVSDVAMTVQVTEAGTEETLVDLTAAPEKTTYETETLADAGMTPEPVDTEGPTVETEGPTEAPTEGEIEPMSTEANKAGDEVIIEDGTVESLSSAQVFGIVIGILLGVAFLIGVVVAVVRRRGKYSP